MKLYETDWSDVDIVHDYFNPSPKYDSKGVMVLFRRGFYNSIILTFSASTAGQSNQNGH